MRIVHGDQIEEKIRIHQHRQGMFRYRTVAAGEPGTPGNFILEMVRTTDDFFSPRHKHNFDQFRYQLEGEFDFDRNGKMTPGIIGYFPEGTPLWTAELERELADAGAAVRRRERQWLHDPGADGSRHRRTQEAWHVREGRLSPQRGRGRQTQRRRLSGGMGAREQSADDLSGAALPRAHHDEPRSFRL